MALEKPVQILSFTSASTYTSASQQYQLMKLSATGTAVACSAVTDQPIGVLQNLPAIGEQAEICVLGVTKIRMGTSGSIGSLLQTGADARAVPFVALGTGAITTGFTIGRLIPPIESSTNAGGLLTALVNCINLGRSL